MRTVDIAIREFAKTLMLLADAEYGCNGTSASPLSPFYAQLSGRDEAETVHGLMAELRDRAL